MCFKNSVYVNYIDSVFIVVCVCTDCVSVLCASVSLLAVSFFDCPGEGPTLGTISLSLGAGLVHSSHRSARHTLDRNVGQNEIQKQQNLIKIE